MTAIVISSDSQGFTFEIKAEGEKMDGRVLLLAMSEIERAVTAWAEHGGNLCITGDVTGTLRGNYLKVTASK